MSANGLISSTPRDHAIHALRGLIERGGFSAGDRLPAESKLAAQFAVSRMTVRKALDALEREGLVRRKHNLGCVYAAKSKPTGGLLSRTLVMVTDHAAAPDGQVYGGGTPAIVSGVMGQVARSQYNFLRIAPSMDDFYWLQELIASGTPGVVLSFWGRSVDWQVEVLQRLTSGGVPVVAWGESEEFASYDRVTTDHFSGAEQLVGALADAGCRNILRLWSVPDSKPWIRAHNDAYDRVAETRGLNALPAVYVSDLPDRLDGNEPTFRARVRYVAGYLVEHLRTTPEIDAIMVVTDCETIVVAAALRLFGREDIRVVGYDDNWRDLRERQYEPTPPFATVDKDNHRLGQAMADLLLDRINGKLPDAPQQRVIPQRVVRLGEGHARPR